MKRGLLILSLSALTLAAACSRQHATGPGTRQRRVRITRCSRAHRHRARQARPPIRRRLRQAQRTRCSPRLRARLPARRPTAARRVSRRRRLSSSSRRRRRSCKSRTGAGALATSVSAARTFWRRKGRMTSYNSLTLGGPADWPADCMIRSSQEGVGNRRIGSCCIRSSWLS